MSGDINAAAERPEAVHAPPWAVRDDDGRAYIVGPKSGPGWYDSVADDVSNHETAEWIVKCVNERDALVAEVERLQEALQQIADCSAEQFGSPVLIARAALAADPPPQKEEKCPQDVGSTPPMVARSGFRSGAAADPQEETPA